MDQLPGETLEQYAVRLRQAAVRTGIELALTSMRSEPAAIKIRDFNINFPRVPIGSELLVLVQKEVSRLREINTTEATGSIELDNSIHRFWSQILPKLRCADGAKSTRIVYEWAILNPLTLHSEVVDFTFIPSSRSHCNWLEFMGGLEAKNNPKPHSSCYQTASGGLVNTDGMHQAMKRCSLSVQAK